MYYAIMWKFNDGIYLSFFSLKDYLFSRSLFFYIAFNWQFKNLLYNTSSAIISVHIDNIFVFCSFLQSDNLGDTRYMVHGRFKFDHQHVPRLKSGSRQRRLGPFEMLRLHRGEIWSYVRRPMVEEHTSESMWTSASDRKNCDVL